VCTGRVGERLRVVARRSSSRATWSRTTRRRDLVTEDLSRLSGLSWLPVMAVIVVASCCRATAVQVRTWHWSSDPDADGHGRRVFSIVVRRGLGWGRGREGRKGREEGTAIRIVFAGRNVSRETSRSSRQRGLDKDVGRSRIRRPGLGSLYGDGIEGGTSVLCASVALSRVDRAPFEMRPRSNCFT